MNRQIYIHREIESVLKRSLGQFPAIAISGPRQSGKSTLVKTVFGKTHNFVSFDDPLNRERAISDPKLFIDSIGQNIIFDEIQYVPQILSYIKILIDQKRQMSGRFIITGSQQFSLIKNLGDSLAGRIALFDLLPFSIEEKRRIPSIKNNMSDALGCFTLACLETSFPEISVKRNIDPDTWCGSYLQTYLERDIRTIYDVGILREFQQFLSLLAGRCSQTLNLSSFSNDLGVSVNTIKKWISILEASRIIYLVPPYYRNLGKRIIKSPKVYFLDIGLVCYLTGIKTKEHILNGPMAGALFENFIVQETVKYILNKGARPRLYFIRTHNNVEVDLIIEKNLELYPFEIKFTKTPNTGMAEPIEKIGKLFAKLKVNPGKIISLSEQDLALTKNVSVMSMSSYLKHLDGLV